MTEFSRVLASITTASDGRLQVLVPPDWLQGRTVFGGMQMAIAVRGMRAAMADEARALPGRRRSSGTSRRAGPSARSRSPAWCLIDTEVRAGTDGYLSQTSVLHGPDGHAYAVSHQTVGVFG